MFTIQVKDKRTENFTRGKTRDRKVRGQHAENGPGLAAVFGDEPACFGGNPRERQRQKGELQEAALFGNSALDRVDDAEDEEKRHRHAATDHQTEGPEHRRDRRGGVGGRLTNHLGSRFGDIVRVAA